VRSAPLASALLTAVSIVLLFYVSRFATDALANAFVSFGGGEPILVTLADAIVQALLVGYLGIVMAKVYADVSFTAPRW
jgi:hypothetical protein